MATTSPARISWMARLSRSATWAAFVVAVAIAGAGLTLALDHPQTDSGRPELTARGDALVGPRLAALQPAVADLAAAADEVATHARDLYGDVRARDTTAARAVLAAGDLAAVRVTLAAITVQAGADALLDGTSLSAVSASNRATIAAIGRAIAAAVNVTPTWGDIAAASVLPMAAVESLADHDAIVLAATGLARDGDFAGALSRLGDARAPLDRARSVVEQAREAGRDTRTLFDWITRSADYDDALTGLYALLVQTAGVVTPEVQTALATVERAEQALPANNSALVVIVSDLGGQAITLGLIELDKLRGEIAPAVDSGPADGEPSGVSPLRGVARR